MEGAEGEAYIHPQPQFGLKPHFTQNFVESDPKLFDFSWTQPLAELFISLSDNAAFNFPLIQQIRFCAQM